MGNRKDAEEYILKFMKDFDNGINYERYKNMFSKMSDKEFDSFMSDIRDKKEVLYVYSANAKDVLSIDHVLELAKKYNVEVFERIWMYDRSTESYYLTPHKYVVLQVPVRRMSQFIDHKLSVPEGDTKIDLLTGQVSREDAAGGLSQTEVQTLYARGFDKVITELMKFRGGDVTAYADFKRELEETGAATINKETNTTARASVIMDGLFAGMHIESNASGR